MQKTYYKLAPSEIVEDITHSNEFKKIRILGNEYLIYPSIYPSEKFRTTNFLLESLKPLLKNIKLCDMGCGMGIVGLYALQNGAKKVVQADINAYAVENAKANKDLNQFSDDQLEILESDCFDKIQKQTFDLIVFNIPFHNEPHEIQDSLEYAFHDPGFDSTCKFLIQAKNYSHATTKIIIAFSSKGDLKALETLFSSLNYDWKLWKITNTDQQYDNRLYLLEQS